MALPLESLIEDYSFSAGTIDGAAFSRSVNTVFSCNIVLPSSPTQEGVLFEIGGAGTGTFVGLRDSGATFRLRAGDGAATLSAPSSDCALLDIATSSSSYFDGNSHDVVWEIRINPGSVRLWIDGNLVGESYTSGYGALDGSNFGGGDGGGYGVNNSSSMTGEPTTSWPYTLNSSLSVYSDQGVLTDGFRITETSDARIDESGNVRVTENLVEASASVSGSGTTTSVADLTKGGVSALNGLGSLSSQSTVSYQAASNLSSLGSEITVSSVVTRPSVSLSASGSVTATGGNYFSISESYTGTGTATFLGLNTFNITQAFNGTGTATFNGLRTKNASVALSASSTFTNDGFNFVHYGAISAEDEELIRITEAGDTRVDEADNIRIVVIGGNVGVGSLEADCTQIIFSSTAYVKWNGEWTTFTPKVKQDGTWDDPLAIYKKIDANTWKRAY